MRSFLARLSLGPVSACIALAATVFTTGCGRQALLSADGLPVQRVVIYRNGIAYFERAGHVDTGEVRFKMKQTEVGDFLATLAVMEKGGSSVRAAAFPLKIADEDEEPKARRDMTPDEKKGLQTVVLSLDGREHDLQVGYVAESPVWRPSYRLVVRPDGDAELQAWGIVENVSGEDWKNVRLSLIAGAPLAFESTLGTPVIPTRPTVTDEGEVIASVPHSETSLRQGGSPPPPPPAAMPAPESPTADKDMDGIPDDEDAAPAATGSVREAGGKPSKKAGRSASRAAGGGGGGYPGAPPAQAAAPAPIAASAGFARVMPTGPRDLRSLAAVAAEGGSTRYDLPNAVTIPDKSATMVMLLSKHVPGEAIFLFAPDGGVPDSASHPFRVARFNNKVGGVLERGPIAVFEEGAFLGQGMVDPLPEGATATVPFALERSVAVDQDRKFDELGGRIAKIENGELTIERDSVTQTKYRVRNGGEQAIKILVKHPRAGGTRLYQPPKDTEDNVGTGTALVPGKVGPRATEEILVEERAIVRRQTDWFSPVADNAFKAYLADSKADRAIAQKLSAAWVVRNDIVQKTEQRGKLQQESNNLSQSTEETRRNLRAIEKNKQADALRAKLTQRLSETATRLDDLNRQIVELDSKLAELRVQFKEAIRDIKLTTPPPPPLS